MKSIATRVGCGLIEPRHSDSDFVRRLASGDLFLELARQNAFVGGQDLLFEFLQSRRDESLAAGDFMTERTLAVQADNLASDERLAEASTAALTIVAVGLIPLIALARMILDPHRVAGKKS